jgi:tetratricopeptide (TPR) repeat protein
MEPEPGSVRLGEEALAAGDWEAARVAFTAAVAADPSPNALDGLGRTLWWLGDVGGAIEHRERAYAVLRERGDVERAALIALWLAREYQEAVGNEPAGNGWLARAEGMLRDAEPGVAHGWLELTKRRPRARSRSSVETGPWRRRRWRSSAARCCSSAASTRGSRRSTNRWSRSPAAR